MSLARLKNWVLGETLNAADLNAEFNHILNNPMSLISPITNTVDMDGNILKDAAFTNTPVIFTDGDTTPSVAGGTVFKTANTTGTIISALDAGNDGQIIWVIINDTHTTVDFTGTTLIGHGGVDWTPTTGDSFQAVFVNPNWYCRI
jgi:hypothetical protein